VEVLREKYQDINIQDQQKSGETKNCVCLKMKRVKEGGEEDICEIKDVNEDQLDNKIETEFTKCVDKINTQLKKWDFKVEKRSGSGMPTTFNK